MADSPVLDAAEGQGNIREQLTGLDSDVLHYLAKTLLRERSAGLENDKAIVDALVTGPIEDPIGLPPRIRRALKAELDFYVGRLKDSDGELLKQIGDRINVIDSRLAHHDERLEENAKNHQEAVVLITGKLEEGSRALQQALSDTRRELEHKIESSILELKAEYGGKIKVLEDHNGVIDWLPKLLALVAAVFALGGVGWTLFDLGSAHKQIHDATKQIGDLQSDYSHEVTGIHRFALVQDRAMIDRWCADLYDVMMEFSTTLPPEILYTKLDSDREQVSSLRSNASDAATRPVEPGDVVLMERDDRTVMNVLMQVYGAMEKTRNYANEKAKLDGQSSSSAARALATAAWQAVDTAELATSQDRAYHRLAIQIDQYKRNALAVFEVDRVKEQINADNLQPLRDAVKQFESNAPVNLFPRLDLNHAAAILIQIDWEAKALTKRGSKDLAGLNPLFEEGMQLLVAARTDDAPDRFVSSLYNNEAYYYLQKAWMQKLTGRPVDAELVIAARDRIGRAEKESQAPPVVFVTAAEIESFDLSTSFSLPSPLSSLRKDRFDKICSLFQEAARSGYFKQYADGHDFVRDFLEKDQFFQILQNVTPDWKRSLTIAAGFEAPATQPSPPNS